MRIYIAELMIISDDNGDYEVTFSFEQSKREFKYNKETNEFTYFKDWVSDRIPKNMSIEPSMWGGYKVVQGFEENLNEEQLKKLEDGMRMLLMAKLEMEKEKAVNRFEEKIVTLQTKESRKFIGDEE